MLLLLLLLVCIILPALDVRYDILEYHHTALRMPYFYWKMENVLSSTLRELVQFLKLTLTPLTWRIW